MTQAMPDSKTQINVHHQAAQIPAWIMFICRRVITVIHIILRLSGTPFRAMLGTVLTGIGVQRWHAMTGKIQVVGALIITAFRVRLGGDIRTGKPPIFETLDSVTLTQSRDV